MTKLKINRIFAYIFILLSLAKVVFSLIFLHTSDVGETVIHIVDSVVHVVLLVFLCKQVIKNKIGHFFHEYFLEAIIMGGISIIAAVYSIIIHKSTIDDSLIKLLPLLFTIAVNIFLIISFHHHHDKTVKVVLIIFLIISAILNINSVVGNAISYSSQEIDFKGFMISLISNLLSLSFNIFVLLTAVSMKHVLRKDPTKVVDYVKLEEDNE